MVRASGVACLPNVCVNDDYDDENLSGYVK